MSDDDAPGAWIKPSQAAGDVVVACALLGIGLVVLTATRALDYGSADAPGPGMFPGMVAAALILVGGAMLAGELRRLRRDPGAPVPLGHANSGLAAASLLAVALAFEAIGFPLACFLMTFLLVKVLARGGIVGALVFAAAVSAVTYLVFTRGFAISLPLGRLFAG